MIGVWGACVSMFTLLPFHAIDRRLTLEGVAFLTLFIGAFCFGTIVPRRIQSSAVRLEADFSVSNRFLIVAGVIASIAFAFDIGSRDVFDLVESYELRSVQSNALMEGVSSDSSFAFKIGFLTYPAAFIYLARSFIFDKEVNLVRVALFGALPILFASLAMGGRSPLLYSILLCLVSLRVREKLFERRLFLGTVLKSPVARIVLPVAFAFAMYYFVIVFLIRAEGLGGTSNMFLVAESVWGIAFSGPLADGMRYALGDGVSYLIFVFVWYIVQGFLFGAFILDSYDGPMQWGIYGIDLMAAIMRRVDGSVVSDGFFVLQELGTYGFFPSAFGSLFVDFSYFGVFLSVLWGVFAGVVYRRVKTSVDTRWFLLWPFVTLGILFSVINTPIGFSNGLMIHFWLFATFFSAQRVVRAGVV